MTQLQRVAIAPEQIINPGNGTEIIALTQEQQHYLTRVLRLGDGSSFIAIVKGGWWLANLQGNTAEIISPMTAATELPGEITLLIAMPKGNGFDDIVRQTTEMGVTRIYPVVSDRTLLAPSSHKVDRWRRIATEAAEQSKRQIVPTISEPLTFTTAIQSLKAQQQYICLTHPHLPHLLPSLQDWWHKTETAPAAPPSIIITTGPEGGWTPAEEEAAALANFQPVSLGSRILRAITAPIVALSLVAAVLESKI
ncbi:MAG TPA: 16S rRNA (uracil(1498)-N(3))-methyltransferase [Oscillatoriaceae cyanobacterium M33_DOE_052]|uniref:Ribosomal RNA small subunit methyltransferase E n=1 Tax=Planktothricoides sp. SpSt-374 TaxID=2282167 RepID=A0A7C3VSJ5_9CYAN|nr:16S rRNA (uracil(1498)-N(3))-methyltransferase [Oscillatoriaceae cyanobacterium M33_DOE_052]